MVSPMRLDRPRSAGNRVRAISASPRDEALLAEHGADLLDGGVRARQHQLGWAEIILGQLGAGLADAGQQALEGGLEGALVVGVDRLLELLVEPVQLVHALLGNLELPLAHDSDDHLCSSSAGALGVSSAGRSSCVGAPW